MIAKDQQRRLRDDHGGLVVAVIYVFTMSYKKA